MFEADLFPTKRRDVRKAGGDFKIVHKLNGGSLGWILNVEWLRSLRKRGEVLKSCAKLNGESLGWCLPVGTHYYLLLISVQSDVWIGTRHSGGGGALVLVLVIKYTLRSTRVFDLDVFEVVDCFKFHEFSKFRDADI